MKSKKELEQETGIKFLTIKEVALLMGISEAKAREIFHTDGFPRTKPGKELLVEKSAFKKFYEEERA